MKMGQRNRGDRRVRERCWGGGGRARMRMGSRNSGVEVGVGELGGGDETRKSRRGGGGGYEYECFNE